MRHFDVTGAKRRSAQSTAKRVHRVKRGKTASATCRCSVQAVITTSKAIGKNQTKQHLVSLPPEHKMHDLKSRLCTFRLQEPGSKFTPVPVLVVVLFNRPGAFGAGSAALRHCHWLSVRSIIVEQLTVYITTPVVLRYGGREEKFQTLCSVFVQFAKYCEPIIQFGLTTLMLMLMLNGNTAEPAKPIVQNDHANAAAYLLDLLWLVSALLNDSGGSGDLWNKMQVSSH